MTYRELQAALKNLRNAGYAISVKLTASLEILLAEYNRLTAITTQPPSWGNEPTTKQPSEQLEVPPDGNITLQLGGNIKEPTENPSQQLKESIAIAQPHQGSCYLPPENPSVLQNKQLTTAASQQSKPISAFTPKLTPKLTQKTLKAIWDRQLKSLASPQPKTNTEQPTLSQGKAEPAPRRYLHDQRHSGGYSDRQNSPRLAQQELKFICINHPVNPYWIDGTQLGQNLDQTQAQALRNLEDGINWLRRLAGKLKAFESGIREGLKNTSTRQQASLKQSNIIPIERYQRSRFANVPPTNSPNNTTLQPNSSCNLLPDKAIR